MSEFAIDVRIIWWIRIVQSVKCWYNTPTDGKHIQASSSEQVTWTRIFQKLFSTKHQYIENTTHYTQSHVRTHEVTSQKSTNISQTSAHFLEWRSFQRRIQSRSEKVSLCVYVFWWEKRYLSWWLETTSNFILYNPFIFFTSCRIKHLRSKTIMGGNREKIFSYTKQFFWILISRRSFVRFLRSSRIWCFIDKNRAEKLMSA